MVEFQSFLRANLVPGFPQSSGAAFLGSSLKVWYVYKCSYTSETLNSVVLSAPTRLLKALPGFLATQPVLHAQIFSLLSLRRYNLENPLGINSHRILVLELPSLHDPGVSSSGCLGSLQCFQIGGSFCVKYIFSSYSRYEGQSRRSLPQSPSSKKKIQISCLI